MTRLIKIDKRLAAGRALAALVAVTALVACGDDGNGPDGSDGGSQTCGAGTFIICDSSAIEILPGRLIGIPQGGLEVGETSAVTIRVINTGEAGGELTAETDTWV